MGISWMRSHTFFISATSLLFGNNIIHSIYLFVMQCIVMVNHNYVEI